MDKDTQTALDRFSNLLLLDDQYVREQLKRLLVKRSLMFANGERQFVLSSGQPSSCYVDSRLTSLRAEGIALLARLLWEEMKEVEADAIGGPLMGSLPLSVGLSFFAYLRGKPIDTFAVRKSKKSHGNACLIEGPDITGKRVILVDDVINTGATLMNSIQAVREQDAEIVKILAVVDREDLAAEIFAKGEMHYSSLFRLSELLDAPL